MFFRRSAADFTAILMYASLSLMVTLIQTKHRPGYNEFHEEASVSSLKVSIDLQHEKHMQFSTWYGMFLLFQIAWRVLLGIYQSVIFFFHLFNGLCVLNSFKSISSYVSLLQSNSL